MLNSKQIPSFMSFLLYTPLYHSDDREEVQRAESSNVEVSRSISSVFGSSVETIKREGVMVGVVA